MIAVVFWLDLRPLLRQRRKDRRLLPSQEFMALALQGGLGRSAQALRGRQPCWAWPQTCVAFRSMRSPRPGLKTIIKIYLKKSPSLLLLTLAIRYKASTECCIQKSCLPGLFPSCRTILNLVGLFSHVFLMRKYFRDYWHHRFLPFRGFCS